VGAPVQVCWVKRIDNTRLLRQRDPSYLRETSALIAGTLACLAIVLLCAWMQFEAVHAGYRLEELRARHNQVLEWNHNLRLEQAALLDPLRIDQLARNRLGLAEPTAHQLTPLGSAEAVPADPMLARRGGAHKPVSLAD
jgi:cell division protein FtsL